MAASPEAEALERLIGFGRELRRRGLPHGTGRASLIFRPEDAEAFDAAFDEWFREGIRIELDLPMDPDVAASARRETGGIDGLVVEEDRIVAKEWHALDGEEETEGEAAIRIVASAVEVLREKSFADLSDEERARVALLIRRLAVRVPTRRPRRYRPASAGSRFDVKRTIRRS